ncbi:MAG: hypothetical protein JST82_07830 [Bacteroidetes bacterium]|nr:hypothetical protein [Bacteroidota bacterium]
MKPYLLIIPVLIFLSSCRGWSDDSKKEFLNSCTEQLKSEGKSETEIKSICDCRLEKIMKKYPDVEEAMEHMDAIAADTAIALCK